MSEPSGWSRYSFQVGLPHLQPHRLSEVELCKLLGDYQWRSLASAAGLPPAELRSEAGHRLHASMVSIELGLGAERQLEDFDEGSTLEVWNRIGLFGGRLVEGLFLFDAAPLPTASLASLRGRPELYASGRPYLYMTNAFVSHAAGAPSVASPVFPEGLAPELELTEMPAGIREQMLVERSGHIEAGPGEESLTLLAPPQPAPVVYPLVPESDISGAGLLYCARAIAVTNIAERIHLAEKLARPLSTLAISFLSLEQRRIYYFAAALPGETLLCDVEVGLLPVAPDPPSRWRVPLRLVSRVDLRRASDGVLIVSSRARKALRVPGSQKSVLTEAERFLNATR